MHAILNGAPEEIGFAWSSVIFKNYDSKGALSKPRYRRFKERDASGRRLHKAIIDVGSGFGLAVRKTCFERVGMFDPHFKLGEDTELFLRLMSSGYKPAICTDVGVAVHSHGGFARYFAGLRERTRTGVFLRLVERYLDFMSRHPALLVAIAGRGALISYLCGDFRSGDRLLAILARTIPAQPHGWASILKNVGARSVCKFIYVARLHPRHVNPEAQ
ncbi:MAG: hypothetical protein K0S28_1276, partial [Paucimonas sp.]|nr:hypothetical protein [Paucimonas sp.]